MVVPTAADQPLASRNFTQENCIFKYSEHDPESIVAKAPQPHVDLDSIREWIDFCEDHHSPSCPKRHTNAKGGTELRGFRVIDCNDETIVPSSLDQPFVALSYVWGQMREQISSKWPQVVIDAIEVTKTLGFRYLWVDRYCIDQDNADEKHDQITNMDTIYESAQLTIMAAAGKNAEYGLPGVARGRVVPRSLDLDGISVGALPRDVCQSVHSSVWWSRGWTYQEGVLSRRRLIFTDDQVYFQCHNMINYEIFDIPLNKFHLASRMSQRDLIRPCLFTGDSANQPSSKSQPSPQIKQDRLLYHIRNYSHRTLSYTSDGLNAFQGIISATQLRT
ncbi:HET-domain-containing protein, partial [Stipitochalara longipes BDJ]